MKMDENKAKEIAEIMFSDVETRNILLNNFEIEYRTDGSVGLNKNVVCDFASFLCSRSEFEWDEDATDDNKINFCLMVVSIFIKKVIEQSKYLPPFSCN